MRKNNGIAWITLSLRAFYKNKNEKLLDLVCSLSKKIQYLVSKTQRHFATRVQMRNLYHIKRIIVYFNNRYIKKDFMATARAAIKTSPIIPTDVGLQGNSKIFVSLIIFVNDHLFILI